ncbi:MAG: amidase [Vicinamibacterales bacterium]
MTDPTQLSAREAARQLASGRLSAEALVRACLDRITDREAEVQAWETVDSQAALAAARGLDRASSRGPLHGVPIGVKDIIATADLPTQYGSSLYHGHRPPMDAAVVSLARRAGALILGKTVTTEFATSAPARTRNPLNLDHTPGGSSSGSAAAVADRMVPLAFGTQTAGSVIRPAAFCGVVGYKPSHGTLPRAGVKATSDTLDTVGVLARTVGDAAWLVAALTGRPDLEPARSLTSPGRLGWCRTPQWPQALQETRTALERAATLLDRAGLPVAEVEFPDQFVGLFEAQQTIMAFETARELLPEYLRDPSGLTAQLRERIEVGLRLPFNAYATALDLAAACRASVRHTVCGCDALLVPAAPGEAPVGFASTGDPVMNRVWTLLHTPCVTVPVLDGPNGLPVGVQVVAAVGRDEHALAIAARLQQLAERHPQQS